MHVDNLEVVEGIQRGQAYCCMPNRDGADIWKEVWASLRDLGKSIRVVKVKAHLKLSAGSGWQDHLR